MAIMHLLLQRMKYRKLAEMQWQIIPIIRIGQSILHIFGSGFFHHENERAAIPHQGRLARSV